MFKIEITGSTYAELRDNLVEVFAGLDLKQPTPVKIDNSYPEKADQFDNAIPFPDGESSEGDDGQAMAIGQNIRRLREAFDWKQETLAEVSGLTRASIGNYERGDRVPPVDAAKRIADALNTTVDKLMGGEQKDAPVEKAEEAAPETKVAPTEKAAAVTVTFQDLKDLISKAVTNKKAADVKKILAKFGAKKPSEFQEADYPTIADELKELV